jgi:hypothetical protein
MMAIIEKKPESRAVPEAVCGGDPGPGSPGAPAARNAAGGSAPKG